MFAQIDVEFPINNLYHLACLAGGIVCAKFEPKLHLRAQTMPPATHAIYYQHYRRFHLNLLFSCGYVPSLFISREFIVRLLKQIVGGPPPVESELSTLIRFFAVLI